MFSCRGVQTWYTYDTIFKGMVSKVRPVASLANGGFFLAKLGPLKFNSSYSATFFAWVCSGKTRLLQKGVICGWVWGHVPREKFRILITWGWFWCRRFCNLPEYVEISTCHFELPFTECTCNNSFLVMRATDYVDCIITAWKSPFSLILFCSINTK